MCCFWKRDHDTWDIHEIFISIRVLCHVSSPFCFLQNSLCFYVQTLEVLAGFFQNFIAELTFNLNCWIFYHSKKKNSETVEYPTTKIIKKISSDFLSSSWTLFIFSHISNNMSHLFISYAQRSQRKAAKKKIEFLYKNYYFSVCILSLSAMERT